MLIEAKFVEPWADFFGKTKLHFGIVLERV